MEAAGTQRWREVYWYTSTVEATGKQRQREGYRYTGTVEATGNIGNERCTGMVYR